MIGTIHGRLTRDPEIRKFVTQAGEDGQVVNFTVASSNRYGAKTESSFYPCYVFGKRAEVIEKFFKKGSEIVVTGNLEQEEYQTKDGETKRVWKMGVVDFDFCGKATNNQQTDNTESTGFENVDESIPF